MRNLIHRIFGRRTTAASARPEPGPYDVVWTTGALPEDDADEFADALRAAYAEELIGEDGAR